MASTPNPLVTATIVSASGSPPAWRMRSWTSPRRSTISTGLSPHHQRLSLLVAPRPMGVPAIRVAGGAVVEDGHVVAAGAGQRGGDRGRDVERGLAVDGAASYG